MPMPTIDDATTCVVDTGAPTYDDASITTVDDVSLVNPSIGCEVQDPSADRAHDASTRPCAVPIVNASPQATFTQSGTAKLFRCPPATSSAAITPIAFWPSLEPG